MICLKTRLIVAGVLLLLRHVTALAFACFKKGFVNKRPSRLTILRAKKLLDRDKLRAQIEGCVYPPRYRRIEELQRELIEIRETLDRLRASNYKNDIMGETIIKKHKFN